MYELPVINIENNAKVKVVLPSHQQYVVELGEIYGFRVEDFCIRSCSTYCPDD